MKNCMDSVQCSPSYSGYFNAKALLADSSSQFQVCATPDERLLHRLYYPPRQVHSNFTDRYEVLAAATNVN